MSASDYRASLVPTDTNATELREKILGILIKLKAYNQVDVESLTHDIFLEAWQGKTPVTFEFIRHRMLNAIRNAKLYTLRVADFSKHPSDPNPTDLIAIRTTLSLLMKRANVTAVELQVIYMIIYRGLSHSDVASAISRSESQVREIFSSTIVRLQAAGRSVERE